MRTSVLDSSRVDEELLPCRANDAELFFAESPSDVELAKAMCQACPVRLECLAGALERAPRRGADGPARAAARGGTAPLPQGGARGCPGATRPRPRHLRRSPDF